MSSEPEFFYDVQQGCEDWFELRKGCVTASEFQTVLAGGKTRETYLRKKAGEVLSGVVNETLQPSFAMQRGKLEEPEARDYFSRTRFVDVKQCGFVRRQLKSGSFVGCSPDGLFDDAVLELKSKRQDLAMADRENGYNPSILPAEHVAQCQGALWVTGLARVELLVYSKGMPYQLHYAAARDEPYIAKLEAAVEQFDKELRALVKKHKAFA